MYSCSSWLTSILHLILTFANCRKTHNPDFPQSIDRPFYLCVNYSDFFHIFHVVCPPLFRSLSPPLPVLADRHLIKLTLRVPLELARNPNTRLPLVIPSCSALLVAEGRSSGLANTQIRPGALHGAAFLIPLTTAQNDPIKIQRSTSNVSARTLRDENWRNG